jgi:2-oxoisovalerate ferredoxin oxidoreductase beta subunit
MAELLATLEAPVYIERVSLGDNKNIIKARKAVRKAIENQKNGKGFSFVEILSPCPTILKMDPVVARKWVNETLTKNFPLGCFRDKEVEVQKVDAPQHKIEDVLGISKKTAAPTHELKSHGRDLTIKIAGFGGQGILLLGQMMAEMGMREKLEVAWLPSYGPEMRSGSAHCHVTLAHERIGSPLISHPEVLVAMNEISLRKFGPQVAHGGIIFYNRDRVPEDVNISHARIICLPASEIADQIGSAKVANVVMLGAILEETECLSPETAMRVIEETVRNPKMLEFDRKAMEAGRQFVDNEVRVGAVSQPDGYSY